MIRIQKTAWEKMVSHVESTFPKEGCGLMIGTDGVVEEAVPLPNSYTGAQEDFFVIDPKTCIAWIASRAIEAWMCSAYFIRIPIATPIFPSATWNTPVPGSHTSYYR